MESSQVTDSEFHKPILLGSVFLPETHPSGFTVQCSLDQINTFPCNEAGKGGGTKALGFTLDCIVKVAYW